MAESSYAFAVANVRQLENSLLTKPQMESLINAVSVDEAVSVLSSKGWEIDENTDRIPEIELAKTYSSVKDLLGNSSDFQIFILQNDFHNLKAAIKSLLAGVSADEYFIIPTSLDLDELKKSVSERNFETLPEFLKDTAKAAFDILSSVNDGQAVDTLIDRETLKTILNFSKRSESALVKKYADRTVAAADLKIAYRGASAMKKYEFFREALVNTDLLDADALSKAAAKGCGEVIGFAQNIYPDFAAALKISVSELEKVYDESIAALMYDTVFSAFGSEPVLAYYYKKLSEIKNVRIILTCKNMGMKAEKITERVREINV